MAQQPSLYHKKTLIKLKTNIYFPYLYQFFGCYFHQDWAMEYANADEAIQVFIQETSKTDLQHTVHELKKILEQNLDDDNLTKITSSLGLCYRTEFEGLDKNQWLVKVKSALETSLAKNYS